MKEYPKYYPVYMYEKRFNWKKLAIVICVILAIGLSIFIALKLAHNRYANYVQEKSEKDFENLINTIDSIDNNEQQKVAKEHKIPIYNDNSRYNMNNIYTSEYKRVFLTFDDGPSSNVTPLILDVLKENNIKATFFTLGSRISQNPQILKREYEEGHYIANHGYSHVYSNIYANANNLLDEYNRTEEEIRSAIEVPEYSSHLFRFPGGSIGGKYNSVKKQYKKTLGEHEILYVDWNCLNEDATGNRTKEQLVQFIKDTSTNKNSVIVLMHDAGDKILTYETLQEVIDYFTDNGYVFENFYDIMDYDIVSDYEKE